MRLSDKGVRAKAEGLTMTNMFDIMATIGLSLNDIFTVWNNLWFHYPDVEIEVTDNDVISYIEDLYITQKVLQKYKRGQELESIIAEISNDTNYNRVRKIAMECALGIDTWIDMDCVCYDVVLSGILGFNLYYVPKEILKSIIDTLNQKCNVQICYRSHVLKIHMGESAYIFAHDIFGFSNAMGERCKYMQHYHLAKRKKREVRYGLEQKIIHQLYREYCKKNQS